MDRCETRNGWLEAGPKWHVRAEFWRTLRWCEPLQLW